MRTAIVAFALLVTPGLAMAEKQKGPHITQSQRIELKQLYKATPYLSERQGFSRTFGVKMLSEVGVFQMNKGERSIKVHVPASHELRQTWYGPESGFTSHAKLLKSKTGKNGMRIYKLTVGDYIIEDLRGNKIKKDMVGIRRDRDPTFQERLNMLRISAIKTLGDKAGSP